MSDYVELTYKLVEGDEPICGMTKQIPTDLPWPDLIMEFAKLLTELPEDNRYYINLEELQKYVKESAVAQHKEYMLELMEERGYKGIQ